MKLALPQTTIVAAMALLIVVQHGDHFVLKEGLSSIVMSRLTIPKAMGKDRSMAY